MPSEISSPSFNPNGRRDMHAGPLAVALVATAMLSAPGASLASPEQDRAEVAAIDTKYQAAVERNDAQTMAQILDEHFVLVLGTGKTYTRDDLLEAASTGRIKYEHQVEDSGTQTVRVWGDTA